MSRFGLPDVLRTVPVSALDRSATLAWLVRLRWLALGAHLVAVGFAIHALPIPLHEVSLVGGLVILAVTNGVAMFLRGLGKRWLGAVVLVLIVSDTLTLTMMLGASGGTHNPFAVFYLLQVAVASMLLPLSGSLGVVALSSGCYYALHCCDLEICGGASLIPPDLRFRGMLVALTLTGALIAWFVTNIGAELRRSERERAEASRRLDRQERFASLATLAAGVAHELGGPLSTIAVASSELSAQPSLHSRCAACVADARLIRREVDRCRQILDRLSGAEQEAEPQRIRPGDTAAGLALFLDPAHAVRLRVVDSAREPFAAPRVTLFQVLAVLVKNACEADGTGAPVTLTVACDTREVRFTVVDRGPGMSDELAEKAGEPFLSTKPEGEGMGLGLYIGRMFAERMGGRLSFSHARDGFTVTLAFPCDRP